MSIRRRYSNPRPIFDFSNQLNLFNYLCIAKNVSIYSNLIFALTLMKLYCNEIEQDNAFYSSFPSTFIQQKLVKIYIS